MITLSSVRGAQGWVKPAQIIGTVEATMRSLNNALEHLHQSFSYYLLFGESRFISIGMYYPPFILMSIGMLVSV